MKRNYCIENIKNQINAKINANIKSERDYLVFRPKSYIYNPILSKQHNNMTSIFQLENTRKSQTSLMKIRYDSRLRQQKSVELQDHLQIHKCKTFKKFRLDKQKYLKSLESCKASIFRQKRANRQSSPVLKNVSGLNEKKVRNSMLFGTQKKKNFNYLLRNKNSNNLSFQQKENISRGINISRLKPVHIDEEISEITNFRFLREKNSANEKLKKFILKEREAHKRIQTQIPNIFLMKYPQEKIKSALKLCQNYLRASNHVQYKLQKDRQKLEKDQQKLYKDQTYAFMPWDTSNIFEQQEELLEA